MTHDVHILKQTTLARVPSDYAFFVCRGDRITTLKDLANCIETLTPTEFHYHVNAASKTNHFAEWIKNVLKNPLLAHDLNYAVNLNDQKHFVKTIRDHITWLERG